MNAGKLVETRSLIETLSLSVWNALRRSRRRAKRLIKISTRVEVVDVVGPNLHDATVLRLDLEAHAGRASPAMKRILHGLFAGRSAAELARELGCSAANVSQGRQRFRAQCTGIFFYDEVNYRADSGFLGVEGASSRRPRKTD